jgi:hypothetical protein
VVKLELEWELLRQKELSEDKWLILEKVLNILETTSLIYSSVTAYSRLATVFFYAFYLLLLSLR